MARERGPDACDLENGREIQQFASFYAAKWRFTRGLALFHVKQEGTPTTVHRCSARSCISWSEPNLFVMPATNESIHKVIHSDIHCNIHPARHTCWPGAVQAATAYVVPVRQSESISGRVLGRVQAADVSRRILLPSLPLVYLPCGSPARTCRAVVLQFHAHQIRRTPTSVISVPLPVAPGWTATPSTAGSHTAETKPSGENAPEPRRDELIQQSCRHGHRCCSAGHGVRPE
jgi:hypothetical protein